jgi:hypothetical protein
MAFVDLVLTINEDDKPDAYDFELLDALDQMYLVTHSFTPRTLGSYLDEALRRSKASDGTWIGRRPLLMSQCLRNTGKNEEMLVLLPRGSTFRAANAAYSWLQVKTDNHIMTQEDDSDMRHFAHTNIIPLLDTRGELSRYPFDVKIAYDLMYTMKKAMTKGLIGRGAVERVESLVIDPKYPVADLGENLEPRETRQLAIKFTFKLGPF